MHVTHLHLWCGYLFFFFFLKEGKVGGREGEGWFGRLVEGGEGRRRSVG